MSGEATQHLSTPTLKTEYPNTEYRTPNPYTAFWWAGMVCIVAAFTACLLTVSRATQGASPRMGELLVGLLLVASGALFVAHVRSRVWLAVLHAADETHERVGSTRDEAAGPSASETSLSDVPSSASYPPQSDMDTTQLLARPALIWRYEVGAIGLVTLLGAVLRLLAMRHSLWYDELWTLGFMRSGPVYALTHQGSYNNHLLNSFVGSLLLRLRFALTGATPSTGAPAEWVRLPSLLFGVFAVPLLYLAVRDTINRPVALAAALLLAVSPPAIDLSAQTRGYAGVLFCGIAQSYFFARALRTARPAAWVGWLLCAFIGVFAHLYMLFIVIVNGLLVVGLVGERLLRRKGKAAWHLLEQGILLLTTWLALTAVCYSGVYYALRKEFSRTYENGPMARAHEVIPPMLQLWGGQTAGNGRFAFYAGAALLLGFGLFFLARRRPSVVAYLLGLLIVPPLLVEAAHPHFVYPRFFTFALPAFLTLLASGLWQLTSCLLFVVCCLGRNKAGSGVKSGPVSDSYGQTSEGHSAAGGAPLDGGEGFKREGGLTSTQTSMRGEIALFSVLLLGWTLFSLPGLREVITRPKQDYLHAAQRLIAAQREGQAVAVIGAGSEYFKSYGVHPFYPHSEEDLVRLTREHGSLLVADTDIMVNKRTAPPLVTQFVRRVAAPLVVYPGRFSNWPHRWLDGDSDVKIYLLHATQFPKSGR